MENELKEFGRVTPVTSDDVAKILNSRDNSELASQIKDIRRNDKESRLPGSNRGNLEDLFYDEEKGGIPSELLNEEGQAEKAEGAFIRFNENFLLRGPRGSVVVDAFTLDTIK
jgi:hypothetical protein